MQNDPIPIAPLVYFNRSKAYLDCGVDSEKNKRYIFSGPWYNNTPQSPPRDYEVYCFRLK